MSRKSNLTPFEFDSRMVEWNLKHKVINRDQLNKYRESLSDSTSDCETVIIEDSTDSGETGALN